MRRVYRHRNDHFFLDFILHAAVPAAEFLTVYCGALELALMGAAPIVAATFAGGIGLALLSQLWPKVKLQRLLKKVTSLALSLSEMCVLNAEKGMWVSA